ncbi:tetratricopeptide repeat protein [Sunxiuqinia indica]|uniref:tetratricopeptide repeat protein n=1 Tax=Sunxiuqinia indica TaxID=2692584 RepID=UPI001358A2AB|nr:tetratricopeptide repeat protein [Sunxiuqinia indica]
MRTRILLFIILLSGFTFPGYGQETTYYSSLEANIHQAKELFSKNKFIVAQQQFSSIIRESEKGSEIQSEAMFYKALCALRLENKNGEELIEKFIDENPESPYTNKAWFELGSDQFNNGKYAPMLRSYRNLKPSILNKEEQIKVHYQKGYAYFQSEKYQLAENEFEKIKDTNNLYAAPAKYYWAHIQYLNDDYDTALAEFDKLRNNPAFAEVIPFYMSQIYYKKGQYDKVIEFTIPLMDEVSDDKKPELAKIIGNSYFQVKDFQKAIPYFEAYFEATNSKARDENYMLGYCYYVNGQYSKAIEPLENASRGKDELAQNAYYHLADCYVETDQKDKARVAFESASELDFNPDIKEDALFNYAKITYELSYSPFNETIKAFDKYISLYPNSERNDAAYDYLVNVYMSTSNYKEAIESIEKIEVKSTAVKKASQRVTFYRGLELFNNLYYDSAIDLFEQSLQNASASRELKAGALFWKGEANYRLENYEKAISGFSQFLNTSGADSRPEFQTARYNLAYAYFKLQDYAHASKYFQQFLDKNSSDKDEKVADAFNRLGDCYFVGRDYRNAINNYEKAFWLKQYDADYALFQKAICVGIQRDMDQKISLLRTLVQTFPESAFMDDALFELGRSFDRTGQPKVAEGYYRDIINDYPQSSYRPKAILQLGLVQYNQSDFKQSLETYKQVINEYPNSPAAQSALIGVKNNYIELNNIDAYFAYTQRLGSGVQVTVSEQDSLTYLSAEKLYMAKDSKAKAQLEKYLRQYPSGSFSLNAHFYLGELRYSEKEYALALKDYEYVLSKEDNIFTEPALEKAAELQYNAANYQKALSYYQHFESISNTKWNILKARAGKMRCNYKLANYTECIDAAKMLLSSDKLTDILKREANYKLAKSYYETKQFNEALPILSDLAEDTKSAEGAEAKYLLTEILYNQNKLKEAEEQVMDFISKNTPHQYWLAKSFILLSDVYLSQGDQFQAKHTIKSIVENYPETDDGIIETAQAKLQHLESIEQQQEQKQTESPMKINMNEQ